MNIVVAGGGTGGHIIPILAVASELKKLQPDVHIVYIGQRGDGLIDLPKKHSAIDQVYEIPAGKFRRYSTARWQQLLDISTQTKNIRDLGRTVRGFILSWWLLRRLRPTVIFTRGGFVSVPVALAGASLHIPYITHDSDSTPSLANRLIARWASLHAVALPKNLYPYPPVKTLTVGVPVDTVYGPVNDETKQLLRRQLSLPPAAEVILVTGGGNGAVGLNQVVARALTPLINARPQFVIIHMAGRGHEATLNALYDQLIPNAVERERAQVKGFVTDLYRYSGAADVIITRGGASSLAEFAAQGKACIVIPAAQLRWQVHHTQMLAKQGAVLVVDEIVALKGDVLQHTVRDLLDHPTQRADLAAHLGAFAVPDTAHRLAVVLLDIAHGRPITL